MSCERYSGVTRLSGTNAISGTDATALRLMDFVRQKPNVAAARQRWAGGHNRFAVDVDVQSGKLSLTTPSDVNWRANELRRARFLLPTLI
jgi:hypothetical protein